MFHRADRAGLIRQTRKHILDGHAAGPAPPFQIELLEHRSMLSENPIPLTELPPSDTAGTTVAPPAVATQSFFVRDAEENSRRGG